ncbi:MAG: hypothetical protein EOP10_05815 [Proteobacteria bacterium]|nr:MAG: hypothetical protein EOP10_05815 [Pseudomonadota bacterium]
MSYKIVKVLRTIVMGSHGVKPAKANNIVDSLIEDDLGVSELKGSEASVKNHGGSSDQRLLSLVGRFENKIKSSPNADAAGENDDIDADDDSFKKPA